MGLRRLIQFSAIIFRLHTCITRKALFGAPVSKSGGTSSQALPGERQALTG
ncbi:hypothetical protein P3T23_009797 [Paraburkholderia sp. GAS448]